MTHIKLSERGKWSIGWLKSVGSSIIKSDWRERGRLSSDWLNWLPRIRVVRLKVMKDRDLLKLDNCRNLREDGNEYSLLKL